MQPTVAIIAAGAMGSAIAQRLTRHGVSVLTSFDGRSPATLARAKAAGMEHADDDQIAERAKIILSIVPPAEALTLAQRFAGPLSRTDKAPLFVDCNAIRVSTVLDILHMIEAASARFVDAAIIGLPPKADEKGPTLYVSGDAAGEIMELSGYGLQVRRIEGAAGAASALKLSYAGITKGLTTLGAAMVLAAERAGAGQALKEELVLSQPDLLARLAERLPDMYPKAYRWVEEMRAISDFIGQDHAEAKIFEGAAGLYERLAADVAGPHTERAQIDAFLDRETK